MKTAKQYRMPIVPSFFTNISPIERLAVLQLHDAPVDAERAELQMYFNDLYQVFIHRFSQFAYTEITAAEQEQMVEMFQEILKVKALLLA